MDLALLDQTLAANGQPNFRARQIWAWAAKGVHGYEQMTNLPSALRETLARELPFSSLTLSEESHSSDGTVKALFQTADGRPLEAVLMRYRDRPALDLCLLAVRLPAHVHVLRHRPDEIRPQPDRLGDHRPGAALPPDRTGRPLRVHGHGRAAAEPRRGARRLRAPARHRHHPPAHRDLHRRLDPRDRTARRAADAAASRALAARGRRSAALGADARQRPLSPEGRARRLPRVLRAQAPAGVRRVRDARGRQRPLRAGARARPGTVCSARDGARRALASSRST